MKRMMTISIIVVVAMSTGTVYAQWGNWGQQQNAADIIRATGEATTSVMAVVQNRRAQEMAEKEQEFQHEQARIRQREVHYSELPNTVQGQRVSQRLADQIYSENRQMREALTTSLQREDVLVRKLNVLEQENQALQAKISSLEATLEEILRRLPAQQ